MLFIQEKSHKKENERRGTTEPSERETETEKETDRQRERERESYTSSDIGRYLQRIAVLKICHVQTHPKSSKENLLLCINMENIFGLEFRRQYPNAIPTFTEFCFLYNRWSKKSVS